MLRMPDSPDSANLSTPADLPNAHPSRHTGGSRRQSWPILLVGAVATAALVLGGYAVARSTGSQSESASSFSDQQRADAKARACGAFDLVRRGISRNTRLQIPGGPGDVTGTLAAAANARISLYDGGQYLLARIDPATPQELADTARNFANTLMDIGAAATAGSLDSEPDQVARFRSADQDDANLGKLCA